jgi:hypothetical protein
MRLAPEECGFAAINHCACTGGVIHFGADRGFGLWRVDFSGPEGAGPSIVAIALKIEAMPLYPRREFAMFCIGQHCCPN